MDFLDSGEITSLITAFGLVFSGGFALSVLLHYASYAIFEVFALINIEK